MQPYQATVKVNEPAFFFQLSIDAGLYFILCFLKIPVKKMVPVETFEMVNEQYTEYEDREAVREKEVIYCDCYYYYYYYYY